mmetsp:Transcript_3990/g.6338  ORF Transcript_3990/g.6338 Transcript_3990/m.6338 type:complete len:200 (-) Transcript_3990:162-761(-)
MMRWKKIVEFWRCSLQPPFVDFCGLCSLFSDRRRVHLNITRKMVVQLVILKLLAAATSSAARTSATCAQHEEAPGGASQKMKGPHHEVDGDRCGETPSGIQSLEVAKLQQHRLVDRLSAQWHGKCSAGWGGPEGRSSRLDGQRDQKGGMQTRESVVSFFTSLQRGMQEPVPHHDVCSQKRRGPPMCPSAACDKNRSRGA